MSVYNEDTIDKVEKMGLLAYPLSKILVIIAPASIPTFTTDFYNPDHQLFAAYARGMAKSDLAIDLALFTAAQDGDVDALQDYEKRRRRNIAAREQERKIAGCPTDSKLID